MSFVIGDDVRGWLGTSEVFSEFEPSDEVSSGSEDPGEEPSVASDRASEAEGIGE